MQKLYLYKRLVLAKIFIDTHYHEAIDLRNIADEAYFSKFHFIRLFKKIYGDTPHQYLIKVRVDKAKEFLAKGFTVTEACTYVGFDSVSNFSGLFKKITKITPAAYQKFCYERRQNIIARPLQFIPNCFVEQKGWKNNSNFEEGLP